MAKHVLVTGGAGYIGSHACKALRAAGYVPVTYDSFVTGWREAVKFGPLEEGDLADRARLDRRPSIREQERVLAKPNYQYEKRQRDLAKKQKQEEKKQRKAQKGDAPPTEASVPPTDDAAAARAPAPASRPAPAGGGGPR